MTEKHYPYCGGSFDRIIFDKDGSVWVPEAENAKLRELVRDMWSELDAATQYDAGGGRGVVYEFANRMRELGIEVDT